MKATGIIRRLDELGRIVIPREIRRSLKLLEGDALEIYVDKEDIVLRRYSELDTGRYCKAAINVLDKLDIKYAVYDREKRLYSNSPNTFLLNLPTSWRQYKMYTDRNITIYPILSKGEFAGCIATINVGNRNESFSVIASMLSAEMTLE